MNGRPFMSDNIEELLVRSRALGCFETAEGQLLLPDDQSDIRNVRGVPAQYSLSLPESIRLPLFWPASTLVEETDEWLALPTGGFLIPPSGKGLDRSTPVWQGALL